MKKVLAVVAVIAVVCVAGAAFAQTRGNDGMRRMPPQLQKDFSGERGHIDQRPAPFDGEGCGFRGMGRRAAGHRRLGFVPDLSLIHI